MMDAFEIAQMLLAAVEEAVDAGWSDDRIREELEAALDSARDLG